MIINKICDTCGRDPMIDFGFCPDCTDDEDSYDEDELDGDEE